MHTADYLTSPEARRVAARYADWSRTRDGIQTMILFATLAWSHVAGSISRKGYKEAVRIIAKGSSIPLSDARVMARAQCELIRRGLLATGQTGALPDGEAR
jgi:hypothetical protein